MFYLQVFCLLAWFSKDDEGRSTQRSPGRVSEHAAWRLSNHRWTVAVHITNVSPSLDLFAAVGEPVVNFQGGDPLQIRQLLPWRKMTRQSDHTVSRTLFPRIFSTVTNMLELFCSILFSPFCLFVFFFFSLVIYNLSAIPSCEFQFAFLWTKPCHSWLNTHKKILL